MHNIVERLKNIIIKINFKETINHQILQTDWKYNNFEVHHGYF